MTAGPVPPVRITPELPRNCTTVGVLPNVTVAAPAGAVRLNVSPDTVPLPLTVTGVVVSLVATMAVSDPAAGGVVADGSWLCVVPWPAFQCPLVCVHQWPVWLPWWTRLLT